MSFFNRLHSFFLKYLILVTKGNVAYARYVGVVVGNDCRIYTTSFGSEPFLISIGDRVTITSGVKILTHDGSTCLVKRNGRRYQYYAPVKIGNDVFVGVNSILMPGITVGSKVVIGAGSVVTSDVPDNSVVVGSPARIISSFSDLEDKVVSNYVNDAELDGAGSYKDKVYRAVRLINRK